MQQKSPYQPPSSFESAPMPVGVSNSSLTLKQILFSFSGRIPRRTFWLWAVIAGLGFVVPLALLMPLVKREGAAEIMAMIFLVPLGLLFVWVSLALRVKRWHDLDKSGFWVFIGAIPYLGGLISFIFLGCMRGSPGVNRFGDDPT